MNIRTKNLRQRITTTLLPALISLFLFSFTGWGAGLPAVPAADSETLSLGERMYRDSLLPSGEPMTAFLRGDVQVPGTAFSCVSCHLRSGIGSLEGQILSPPTNGAKLYKPYYQYPLPQGWEYGKVREGMWDMPESTAIYRPAYTDQTLAAALRGGVDPTGRELNSAMPRYQLDDPAMATLIAYLKTLSAEISPGVDKEYKYIRFATVVAGDVPAEDRKEMIAMLEGIMAHHNRQGQIRNRYQNMGENVMKPASFNNPLFTVTTWQLTGPASSWRAQLEEYYRKEPVFALLGGLSAGEWQPIHEFSEQNKIPCLLPVTDLPVISGTDWYTLYFSKGIYQEGESAARFLALNSDTADAGRIIQVVEDSQRARALANGFEDTWRELGRTGAPETVHLAPGETISAAKILSLSRHGEKRPPVILLWAASGTLPVLESLAAGKDSVKAVYVSSTLLKQDLWKIPENAREVTYISYPYRVDNESDFFTYNARSWMKKRHIPAGEKRISSQLYALMNVLLDPFRIVKQDFNRAGLGSGDVIMEYQFEMMMHVRRNYYRDYLFDVIGMSGDLPSIDFERLSFGPGQRYLSKGCFIVQLSAGAKPELIKKSDWVVQ